MSYKSFLAFHEAQEPVETLKPIIDLTAAADAHLDIVVMGRLRNPPAVMHDTAPAAEWVLRNKEIMDQTSQRVEEIEQFVALEDISASVTGECDYLGNLERAALRYALCADVHVANNDTIKRCEIVEKAFNETLFDAGCPILILPEGSFNLVSSPKVLIAWNGRVESAQAVRRAIPLLKNSQRINIVSIDPKESDVGEDPGSDLAAHLSRYRLDITIDVLASGGMTVTEKLLQRARDIDADLIVMGGYGHSKLREWLLGGATREMLQAMDIPVLMAH